MLVSETKNTAIISYVTWMNSTSFGGCGGQLIYNISLPLTTKYNKNLDVFVENNLPFNQSTLRFFKYIYPKKRQADYRQNYICVLNEQQVFDGVQDVLLASGFEVIFDFSNYVHHNWLRVYFYNGNPETPIRHYDKIATNIQALCGPLIHDGKRFKSCIYPATHPIRVNNPEKVWFEE